MSATAVPADLIDRAWQMLRAKLVPLDASDAQMLAYRLVFFSGASIVYETIVMLGGDDYDDDFAAAVVGSIGEEIRDFVAANNVQ
jgi:hypothetical protein